MIPARVSVVIEVPRGGHVKRDASGRIEVVSPIPCPLNYGSVEGSVGPDGDPLDAVVCGRSLPKGWRGEVPVAGVVRFIDDGRPDDKLVCGEPRRGEIAAIQAFFHVWAATKRVWRWIRGEKRGSTYVIGYRSR